MNFTKLSTGISVFIVASALAMLLPACVESSAETTLAERSTMAVNSYKSSKFAPEKLVGIGRIEPESKSVKLYPQTSGIVRAVNTQLSDQVKKGEVLFVIDHAIADEQIAKVQSYISGHRASSKIIEANIAKAKINAANAAKNHARIKTAYDQGAETKANLDNTESLWQAALADIEILKANLEAAAPRLDGLKADLRLAQIGRENHFIKAPADGILLQVDVALGASVSPGVLLAEFAPESNINAVAEIDELFADWVRPNQKAYIRKQGTEDTLAVGEVIIVAPALRQKSLFADELGKLEDRRVREVKIRLTKGAEKVLFGQRVECIINVNY